MTDLEDESMTSLTDNSGMLTSQCTLWLSWINVTLITERILQYWNEKRATAEWNSLNLGSDWGNTKQDRALMSSSLLRPSNSSFWGIKHVTFSLQGALSDHLFSLPLHYLLTTAQLWFSVSISVYTRPTNSNTATPGSCSTKVNFMPGHDFLFFLVLVTKHSFLFYLRCFSPLPVTS